MWSAESVLPNSVCYSNGTYFERGTCIVNQNGPKLELLVFLIDKMLDTVVKDTRLLNLTDIEKLCIFVIGFFSEGNINT